MGTILTDYVRVKDTHGVNLDEILAETQSLKEAEGRDDVDVSKLITDSVSKVKKWRSKARDRAALHWEQEVAKQVKPMAESCSALVKKASDSDAKWTLEELEELELEAEDFRAQVQMMRMIIYISMVAERTRRRFK